MKSRQPDNEIFSFNVTVNVTVREKCFIKSFADKIARRLVLDLFRFIKEFILGKSKWYAA